jgi:hypothetical protein
MPVYEAVCLKCGKYHEYVRPVSACMDTPECCGTKTDKRILSAPMARPDIAPWDAYESPATGRMITSHAERREDMRRAGCRDWEGQDVERREATKRKAEDDAKLDAKLDATVRQAWADLPPSKKATLLATT